MPNTRAETYQDWVEFENAINISASRILHQKSSAGSVCHVLGSCIWNMFFNILGSLELIAQYHFIFLLFSGIFEKAAESSRT
jgi:hypothetical protein